ncbi:MAG: HPr family phosphocarrier protein [Selenomonadaceae bacterium]|nr:HPr family phosphocarrier protein [Selenomonadaceae bacterium]
MKLAYKSTKNRKHKVTPIEVAVTAPVETAHNHEVSFIMVAKGVIGFRESARIVKVAEETNCSISIASGKKFGTSKSILSLVNLCIMSGKSLVLNIKGERNDEAFRAVSKIIGGETDGNI